MENVFERMYTDDVTQEYIDLHFCDYRTAEKRGCLSYLQKSAEEFGLKTITQKKIFAILLTMNMDWKTDSEERYLYIRKQDICRYFDIGYSSVQKTINFLVKQGYLIPMGNQVNTHKYAFSSELWNHKMNFYEVFKIKMDSYINEEDIL